MDASQQGNASVIVFDDVSLSFGRRALFKNISLNLRGGQVIGITGANGAGKSTFLKLAGKIIRPDSGEVKLPAEKSFAAISPEMKIYDGLGNASVIIFDDVSLSFGRRALFKDISLNLRGGQVIGITGANGAGKSTFLKLAGKIIRPDSGEVKLPAEKKIAAVSPEMKIYDGLTAEENLFFFAKLIGKTLFAENILELGGRVGLDLKTFGNVRAENFSTGMRQRLKLAILLSVDANIWLLDEPTANLDDDGREKFFSEIQTAKSDKIILLATNDKAEEKICDEIIRLPL